jgi:hypothetical protein
VIYEFRLEATDGSGHFRQGAINADSEHEARVTLEYRELVNTRYRIDQDEFAAIAARRFPAPDNATAGELKAIDKRRADLAEALAADGITADGYAQLAGNDRAKVAFHHQPSPYELVRLAEREA